MHAKNPMRYRRLVSFVALLLALSLGCPSPRAHEGTGYDFHWIEGVDGTGLWFGNGSYPHKGWAETWLENEILENEHIKYYYVTEYQAWRNGNYAKFHKYSRTFYPKRFDVRVNGDPVVFNMLIDNARLGGNWTFTREDRKRTIHGNGSASFHLQGSSRAWQFSTTFDGVSLQDFRNIYIDDYDSLTMRGSSLRAEKLHVRDHGSLTWYGSGASFSVDSLIVDPDASLSFLDLDQTLSIGSLSLPYRHKVSLGAAADKGTVSPFGNMQDLSNLDLHMVSGHMDFGSPRLVNTALTVKPGTALTITTPSALSLTGLNLDGELRVDTNLPTTSLKGGGNLVLDKSLTLSGVGIKPGPGDTLTTTFADFGGSIQLQGNTLTVATPLALGGAQWITDGGTLRIKSPSQQDWGDYWLFTSFLASEEDSLTLDITGEPVNIVASGVSRGGTLRKTGPADLGLWSGDYTYASMEIDGGRLQLGATIDLHGDLHINGADRLGTGSLLVSGKAKLDGNLAVNGSTLALTGSLTVGGNSTFSNSASGNVFDYRGGILSTHGVLDLGNTTFKADLLHPGFYVVADYGTLSGSFNNSGPLTNYVTIHGDEALYAFMQYGSGQNGKILLEATSGWTIMYRGGDAANNVWRAGKDAAFWHEKYNDPAAGNHAWINGESSIAVFGANGAKPYDVLVKDTVTASMVSFLEGGWKIRNEDYAGLLVLTPFGNDPLSKFYHAVLNSQVVGGDAPEYQVALLVSSSNVPVWKTGPGDLVLSHGASGPYPGSAGHYAEEVVVKEGRLILALDTLAQHIQRVDVESEGTLRLRSESGLGAYFLASMEIAGDGRLEFQDEIAINRQNPDFRGSVVLTPYANVSTSSPLALGMGSVLPDVVLEEGSRLHLGWNDGSVFNRRIGGSGALFTQRDVRLAHGSSYTGGTTSYGKLTLEGPGAGEVFTAAGTGDITLANYDSHTAGSLHLIGGGILRNKLHGGSMHHLYLDANDYVLEDNNVRPSEELDLNGTIFLAAGAQLTLQADADNGDTVASPSYSLSGDGSLVFDAPEVMFTSFNGQGLTGEVRLTDGTGLRLDNDGSVSEVGTGRILLAGADSLLLLEMASDNAVLRNDLAGIGRVEMHQHGYALTGNNHDFAGTVHMADGASLTVDELSQVGAAIFSLDNATMHTTNSLELTNRMVLGNGSGIINNASNLTLYGWFSGEGALVKTGGGTLTLAGADKDHEGGMVIREGLVRLDGANLTGDGQVVVWSGAGLAGEGAIQGDTTIFSGASLTVDGSLAVGGNLLLETGSSLRFANNGWLDVGSALTWEDTANLAEINLSGLGVYVLGRYGSTNLADGMVDESAYSLFYRSNQIRNGNQYRVLLTNHAEHNEIVLMVLPTGSKVSFWNGQEDVWDTGTSMSWNTNYDMSIGADETWDAQSRIAVFGGRGVSAGEIKIQGGARASGLFFMDGGWRIHGDRLELMNMDFNDILNRATIGSQAGTAAIDSVMWGLVGLQKTGAGALRLGAENLYTGDTVVSAGSLELGNVQSAGLGQYIELASGTTLRLDYDDSAAALPQILLGNGRLEVASSARLNKASTFTGGTRLLAGELRLEHDTALGTGLLGVEGGSLSLADGLGIANAVSLDQSASEIYVDILGLATLKGDISGDGGLVKTGAGSLALTGKSTYRGDTVVRQGDLIGNIAKETWLHLEGGSGYSGANENGQAAARTLEKLTGEGVIYQTDGLTIASGDFSGLLDTSNNDLTKTSRERLTLTRAYLDHGGQTVVEAGELRFEDAWKRGGGRNTVMAGASLTGYGHMGGDTVIASGASFLPDGVFAVDGNLNLERDSRLVLNKGGRLDVSGALTWEDTSSLLTVNLDSLGVHVLSTYGSTNLSAGLVDINAYSASYNGFTINNGEKYRVELINLNSHNEIVLYALPNAHRVQFWAVDGGGVWDTRGEVNWNTNYIISQGEMEAWAEDAGMAIFGASGITPGVVTVNGPVAASGLFFLDDGWVVDGDGISLQDMDPHDSGKYAVLSSQRGTARILTELSGDVGLHKSGAGTVRLEAAGTYQGDTLVTAGTLELAHVQAAGLGRVIEIGEGAVLRLDYADGSAALPQFLSGKGELEVLSDARLNTAGDFSGGTALAGGLLSVGNNSALGIGDVSLDGGALLLDDGVRLGNDLVLQKTGTIYVDGSDQATLAGSISGAAALAKSGSGQLVLGGESRHSGQTQVLQGTLRLENARLSGGGEVLVHAGATLSGFGQITGLTTVNAGGTLSVDGLLTVSDNLTMGSGSFLEFNRGGKLDVYGHLTWKGMNNPATVNLDSLGIHVLAQYGAIDLAAGLVDASQYQVYYNGSVIGNAGDYRVYLENYEGLNEVVLIAMPAGQNLAFWSEHEGGVWNTDGAGNWSSHYMVSDGNRETWSVDSHVAVFGGSGIQPGEVVVQGPVTANGLFFLSDGWQISGEALTLADFDPQGPDHFAVIGGHGTDIMINAQLTGNTGLHKSGAGQIVLNAANTYGGDTLVSAGLLTLSHIQGLGAGSTVTIEDGAALQLAFADYETALAQTLEGRGTLYVSGAARLDRASVFAGQVRVSGLLRLSDGQALGTADMHLEDGILMLDDGVNVANRLSLAGLESAVVVEAGDEAVLSGVLTGSGTLTKEGWGTLKLSGGSDFTGGTTVNAGTVIAASDTAFGSGNLTMVAGTTLAFAGQRNLANAINLQDVVFISTEGGDARLAGTIFGGGDLVKTGDGILTLSASNQYSGMTHVLNGTLALDGGSISDALALYEGTRFDTGGTEVSLAGLDIHGQANAKGDLHLARGKITYHFTTNEDLDGKTILWVDGEMNVDGSRVDVLVQNMRNLPIRSGQIVTLIHTEDGLHGTVANSRSEGTLGITRTYSAGLYQDAHNLYASVFGVRASEQSKALSEGFLAGLALLNQGADMVARQGMAEAGAAIRRSAASVHSGSGISAFGVTGGGRSRYDTGSRIDMDSVYALAGMAAGGDLGPAWLTAGAFVEWGNGTYDTHNSFSLSSAHGTGHATYTGGGLLGRLDIPLPGEETAKPDTLYLEASVRAGSVSNTYSNSDIRDADTGQRARYEADTPYYSGHVGIGATQTFNSVELDTHVKYFATRQEGVAKTLNNGDRVRFKDADSSRVRLGARMTGLWSEAVRPYIGAGYEHEFEGKARATTYGHAINAPSLRGDTGIGEAGVEVRPVTDLPLAFTLGVQGYVGKREGVSGSLALKWEF